MGVVGGLSHPRELRHVGLLLSCHIVDVVHVGIKGGTQAEEAEDDRQQGHERQKPGREGF